MNIPLATAHRIRPTRQVKHRDEDLLARDDRHIGILIVVEVLVLGHDMVDPRVNVAIESATRLNRPDIHPIHVNIGDIEALRGVPQTVEPDSAWPGGGAATCAAGGVAQAAADSISSKPAA